jgi:hypothetical protein
MNFEACTLAAPLSTRARSILASHDPLVEDLAVRATSGSVTAGSAIARIQRLKSSTFLARLPNAPEGAADGWQRDGCGGRLTGSSQLRMGE